MIGIAQALSKGAAEQASSVEELAATVNKISAHVQETSSNASNARRQSEYTGEQVKSSNQQMREMISAMGETSWFYCASYPGHRPNFECGTDKLCDR